MTTPARYPKSSRWMLAPPMLAAACLVLILPACSLLSPKDDPTQHFVLRSTAAQSNTANPSLSKLIISVGPTIVSGYLDRTQIVVAEREHELKVAEYSIWAESLDNGISHVVSQNLSLLLNSTLVFPFPDTDPLKYDYKVGLWIKRFESDASGTVRLNCTWALARMPDAGIKTLTSAFNTSVPVEGSPDDFANVATAMSAALLQLSEKIHQGIAKNPPGNPASESLAPAPVPSRVPEADVEPPPELEDPS